jgi:prophage DNA circulation protein
MAAFDRLPLASFAGFEFPVREVTVKGSLRYHVHEYLHTPGGSTEDQGRRLYEIKMVCPFHEGFAKWPQLWPEKLAALRLYFEGGQAWDLTIPTLGTISARCTQWEQRMNAKARSGEDCEFTFLEEFQDAFLIQDLITTSTDLPTIAADLAAAVPARDVSRLGITNVEAAANVVAAENAKFDRLFVAIDEIQQLSNQSEQYGAVVATKARNAVALCRDIDNLRTLRDPANWDIVHAMQDVEIELTKLIRDANGKRRETLVYIVQPPAGLNSLSIAQVASRIYGSSERAVELLQLNDLDDALVITAGTTIRYYKAA